MGIGSDRGAEGHAEVACGRWQLSSVSSQSWWSLLGWPGWVEIPFVVVAVLSGTAVVGKDGTSSTTAVHDNVYTFDSPATPITVTFVGSTGLVTHRL
jgi:hypothetical protein